MSRNRPTRDWSTIVATEVDGLLLDKETLRVRAALLDHMIPCLAFALEEKAQGTFAS